MKKRKSERFQINIIKLAAVLVLTVSSSLLAVFYLGSSRIVLEMSDKITDQISHNVIHLTDDFLRGPATYTAMASGFATQLIGDDFGAIPNHEALWKYLWQFLLKTPSLQSFFLADPQGSYVQVRREPRLATRMIDRSGEEPVEKWFYRDPDYNIVDTLTRAPTFDPRTRPWYKVTGTELKNYWSSVYVFTTAQTPGISVTYPVIDSSGKLSAVVCANTPLHALSRFVARQKVSEHGKVFIVNRDEELIAFPDVSRITVKDEASGKLRLGRIDDLDAQWIKQAYRAYVESGKSRNSYQVDGASYISKVFPFPGAYGDSWNIVVALPESDILGSVKLLFLLSLGIGLLISLLSLGAIYFVARAISHQIETLTGEMAYVSSFELDRIKGVDSHIHEIQVMNDSLMKSVATIRSFAKYVPVPLVRKLLKRGEEIRIGGKEAMLTVLFSDIEGFTGIAEGMESEQVMIHLSEYFDHLTHIVTAEQGTVDKYIGDSLMAFWGQPQPMDDAPYRACKAALRCVAELELMNRQWAEQGKPVMKTRFGIHTGMATVGNMGSKERMNYSAVGDNVNIASRLEGINRVYGTEVVISASTYAEVKDQFVCRSLDRVKVKGRVETIRIYELVAEQGMIEPQLEPFYTGFETAYEAWERGDYQTALDTLDVIGDIKRDDRPSEILRDYCEAAYRHFDQREK